MNQNHTSSKPTLDPVNSGAYKSCPNCNAKLLSEATYCYSCMSDLESRLGQKELSQLVDPSKNKLESVLISSSQFSFEAKLIQNSLLIGSDPKADLVLKIPGAKRFMFYLLLRQNQLVVKNLDSDADSPEWLISPDETFVYGDISIACKDK